MGGFRDLLGLVLRWWSSPAVEIITPPTTSFTLDFDHVREVTIDMDHVRETTLNLAHVRELTLDF